jgi:AP2-associated kinase
MKKLLSKIDAVPSGQGNCIGRSWTLPRLTVSADELIAEGGFGMVFLARSGSQKYALKRIVVNNEHDLSVATREIQIMSTLGDHPNLLACLDYMVTPLGGGVTETLCLMPYCRGSLLSVLNTKMAAKTHLLEKEVLQILGDIVAGVARLHQCATPIIHRDLKVENVLEDEGKYVLCDFGSATPKFWDPAVHSVTQIQEELDKYTTLAYRSPEMVDLYSNRGPISTKADIWALGVLLFKMCFYTTPFGDSVLAIQSAHVTIPTTSPFSQQLHSFIHYLLTPDPQARPDIYQVAELCYSLLGSTNPVTNVGGSSTPPSIDLLVASMVNSGKAKPEEKPIKSTSASVTPAPIVTPLETSVTPRQRPKGSMVLPAPVVGATLLPPPKSPKPMESAEHAHRRNASLDTPEHNSGHRRNVSDSSAFDKNALQPSELASSSSEQAISSWNPFEGEAFAAATSGVTATAELGAGSDDDPFENAPFDDFKYRPMGVVGVDLFGSAPFSNPFLDFAQPTQPEGVTNLSFEDER